MTDNDDLDQLLGRAKAAWSGCHWKTDFGRRRLDLAGMRAQQAMIAANATRGDESACWIEAADWLRSVESDASHAAVQGDLAVRAAKDGAYDLAIAAIDAANLLESKYRPPASYVDLADTIIRLQDLHRTPPNAESDSKYVT